MMVGDLDACVKLWSTLRPQALAKLMEQQLALGDGLPEGPGVCVGVWGGGGPPACVTHAARLPPTAAC